jgi:Xaa-Pro aminopeptidase
MAERAFPKEEFEARYRRLRDWMAQSRLDAVVACSPGNQFWLTGCVGLIVSSHETTFAYDTLYPKIVLPAAGDPTLIGLRICADAYAQETHISDIRTFVPPVWERRSALMQHVLRGVDRHHGRVGIDTGEYSTITPAEFKMLKERLPELEFVDVTPTFQELRAIKSIREQACLREAAHIQVEAFRLLRQRIHAGMSETAVLAELARCQVEAGSSETAVSIAWSYPGYAFFRAPWKDRKLQRGDFLWVDGGAVVHGYCSDIDEVFVVGRPTAEHIELFESLEAVYRDGLKLWKTGRKALDIARDTLEVLRRHGASNALDPEIFVGHSLGYEIVESPVFASWSPPELRLQEGMVVCPEWYNQTPYGAMLYEETYLANTEGLEPLVQFDRQLVEIPA